MWIFKWLRRGQNRSNSEMSNPDTIDLGNPPHMVGSSGFTRGAGGGKCDGCGEHFATLMPDHKCARCSTEPFFGPCHPDNEEPEKRKNR